METFKKSYASDINLMPVTKDWSIDHDVEPTLPHLPKKQCGRPKKVRRKKLMKMRLMKVLRSVGKGMMEVVKTMVKKATMLGVAPN